jgi:hypothetical protein
MEQRKLTCGQCLVGVKEECMRAQYRCSVDGQFRGKRTGCKLTDEQLVAVYTQMNNEFMRQVAANVMKDGA